jgi:hypothetical protein
MHGATSGLLLVGSIVRSSFGVCIEWGFDVIEFNGRKKARRGGITLLNEKHKEFEFQIILVGVGCSCGLFD